MESKVQLQDELKKFKEGLVKKKIKDIRSRQRKCVLFSAMTSKAIFIWVGVLSLIIKLNKNEIILAL